jgi:hypothetical protein
MKNSPDERTMNELLSMGKDLEDQARKVYQMSEAFAQKYEQRLENQSIEQKELTNHLKVNHMTDDQ